MANGGLDAKTVTLILNVTTIVGLIISTIFAGVLLKSNHDAVKLALETSQLSSELRQSSDDLTRFIRTYTVTGNASYWDYFQQVIAIRNGLLPLPSEPWRNYWDLYITDGRPPRGFGPPSALAKRFRAAQFTSEELALLDEAQRQSDALIDMEDMAYHAMVGLYRPANTTGLTREQAMNFSVSAPPNQTLAMSLVHGIPYHQWKGRIMRPIDDFAATSAARVRRAIDRNYTNNIILLIVLSAMIVLLVCILLIYFLKVAKDSQTQHLLSAVLPERVVDSITIGQFNVLKDVAKDRAKAIRSRKRRDLPAAVDTAFPVLYSEYLPLAWVAFTDLVNFTKMCRYTENGVVISILNELFSMLDIAALHYGVEKIKTIGDAFMAAKLSTSELNFGLDDRPQEEVVAADGLCMVQFLLRAASLARGVARPRDPTAAENDPTENPFLEIRVGLNAGPCASGIVGFERPLYDLFGDTVNTAARLEATGRAGRIHVLESVIPHFGPHVRELLFDGHSESVVLKGLGSANTRFILGTSVRNDDSTSIASSVSTARKHIRAAAATGGSPTPSATPHSVVEEDF